MFLLAETPKKKVPQRWEHTLCGQSSVQRILKFVENPSKMVPYLSFFPKSQFFSRKSLKSRVDGSKSLPAYFKRSQEIAPKNTTEDLLRMAAAAMDSMVKVPPHTSRVARRRLCYALGDWKNHEW